MTASLSTNPDERYMLNPVYETRNYDLATSSRTMDFPASGILIAGVAVTSTAAELNKLDTVTATATEFNYLDITTLGTGAASKAVVLDAGDDYTWPAAGVLTVSLVTANADPMVITGFTPATTVDGGAITIVAGASIAGATGAGGAVTVTGGAAGSTDDDGGDVTITSGAGAGTGEGGAVILQAADGGTGLDGQIYIRPGTALPIMYKTFAPVADSTTATDMTEAILLSGIHAKDPGGDLNYQLPTGTQIKAALGDGIAAGDSFYWTLINTDATAAVQITIVVDTDITIVGDPNVQAIADTATLSVSSGTFLIRFVTGTTFVMYRVS